VKMVGSNTKAYIGHLIKTYDNIDKNEEIRQDLIKQVQKVKKLASNKRYSKETVSNSFIELEKKITEAMLSSRLILDKEQLILDKENKSLSLINQLGDKIDRIKDSGDEIQTLSQFNRKIDTVLKKIAQIDKKADTQPVKKLSEVVDDLKHSIDQFRNTIQKFNLKDAQIKEIDNLKSGMTNLNLKVSAIMNDERSINREVLSFEENIQSEIQTRKEEFVLVEKQIRLLDERYEALKATDISPARLKEFKAKITATKKKLRTIRK